MRRRGGAEHTGLGGGGRELMDGQPTKNKKFDRLVTECSKDAYETFFKGTKLDYNYCDAGFRHGELKIGIEPSYMHEPLKIICINERKDMSSMVTGYAFVPWGTGIRQKIGYYSLYKNKSKFVKFIDRWHPKLFKVIPS